MFKKLVLSVSLLFVAQAVLAGSNSADSGPRGGGQGGNKTSTQRGTGGGGN